MERDPIGNDARRSRARRRLGPDPVCTLCGQHDTATLVSAPRSLIEEHHVFGRALHPTLTVPLCRNCHAKCSASQMAQGIELREVPDRTVPELLVDVLLQLGAFVIALGEWLISLAERTDTFVAAMDRNGFTWRELAEARA
jgi:hypothetical protein